VSTGGTGARLLGVDGGASKTDAWIVDADGRLLGKARGAGSNHQLVGLEGAMDALDTTVRAALEASGHRTTQPVDIGVYCMAGVDFDVDEQKLGQAIATRGWSRIDVVRNDTMAVLRAGAQSGWGVGVVCGSGLNCVGLAPDGRVERFPSLAELSGDFTPGGAWLGARALGLALRSRDGRGGPTVLTDLVPAYFDRPDPESVVLGGGLFDGAYAGFAGRVEALVSAVAPGARYRHLGAPPVLGSALLALDALGASTDATARLRASAARPADNQPSGHS
jgi:N-acetylglucosamine kinase-like BadF-type ATPase